jgi:hypothetical protein
MKVSFKIMEFYDEVIDEDYKPTDNDIEDYAKFLGADLPEDRDLLYIAEEGILAQLPPLWKPFKTATEDIYYFNTKTGESQWEHPCDEQYRKLMQDAKTAKRRKGGDQSRNAGKPPLSAVDIMEKASKKKKLGAVPRLGGGDEEDKRASYEDQFQREAAAMKEDFDEQKRTLKQKAEDDLEKLRAAQKKKQVEEQVRLKELLAAEILRREQAVQSEFEKKLQDKQTETANRLRIESDRLKKEFQELEQSRLEKLRSTSLGGEATDITEVRRRLAGLQDELRTEQSSQHADIQDLRRILEAVADDYGKQLTQQQEQVSAEFTGKLRQAELARSDMKTQVAIEREVTDLETQHRTNLRLLRSEYDKRLEEDRLRLTAETQAQLDKHRTQDTPIEEQPTLDLSSFKQQLDRERLTELEAFKKQLAAQLEDEKRAAEVRRRRQAAEGEHQLQLQEETKGELMVLKRSIKDLQLEVSARDSELAEARLELKDRTELLNRMKTTQRRSLPEDSHRMERLETELSDLKKELEGETGQSALYLEHQELKAIQKRLEDHRARWRTEVRACKGNPSRGKKAELARVKQILDKQSSKLNERIRELREAESLFRPKRPSHFPDLSDDEFAESELSLIEESDKPAFMQWLDSDDLREVEVNKPTGFTSYTSKLGLYQRHLNRWTVNRDYMRDAMSRHNAWLHNMRDEFSRALQPKYKFS